MQLDKSIILVALLIGAHGCDSEHSEIDDARGTESGGESAAVNWVSVRAENFERDVLQASDPVLVAFVAPWAGPARTLLPVVEGVARGRDERVILVAVDVDTDAELAESYEVRSVPTLVLFVDGEVRDRLVGAVSSQRIERLLDEPLPR
jgi:thioredoxin 1